MKNVNDYRDRMDSRLEELTVMNAKQNSDITHIKDSVDEIKTLIKEQNGRVRNLEISMSGIKAIGTTVSVVLSSLVGYLFKMGR
jgi:hypothetical protein